MQNAPIRVIFQNSVTYSEELSRYVRNNPAKKALLLSSESSSGDEDVKVKPSISKVKKEPLPLGDDSDCIAGNSNGVQTLHK